MTIKKSFKWNPIIKEEVVKPQLESISKILYNSKPEQNYSLFSGNIGVALFLFYYWKLSKNNKFYKKGSSFVTDSFASLNHSNNGFYSLCNGDIGFMLAVNHLVNNDIIAGDCNELFQEMQLTVYSRMKFDIKAYRYDYLHNALGAGIYFLKRGDLQSLKFVETLVVELEKTSEKDGAGLKWRSSLNYRNIEVYNTSLSHGMASIIIFLTIAYKKKVLLSKTKRLLCGAINYILSLKSELPDLEYKSFFPNSVLVDDSVSEYNSRLGWCYGDLGVGISLLFASVVLRDKKLSKTATDVLLQTTSRKDPIKEFVNDAGICHGSAGLSHIYNRLYHYTGHEIFLKSAIYWLNDTLKKSEFKDGLAGYKTFEKDKMVNDKGLLTGISGIGLVLISAISDIEPRWDECFLLSQ